jgi:hypothetical protein
LPVAQPLRLRLFLEGQECPVVGANISVHLNGPATASIQIVPTDEALLFKPRTMVHLFYLDSRTEISGTGKDAKGTGTSGTYRLLFSGETVGLAYIRTPMSRAVVLQCLDFSSYWDACHATVLAFGMDGNLFRHMGEFYGANVGIFDDIMQQQQNRLVEWIKQTPQTDGLKTVTGLAGGVIRMLEAMSGVPNKHRGVNDFFTVAELRCRLLSQIEAEENDSTASRVLSRKVFMQWLLNGLQNAGLQVTFRDILRLLFSYIHYDVVPNPAPFFDPPESLKWAKARDLPPRNIGSTNAGKEIVAIIDGGKGQMGVLDRIDNLIEKDSAPKPDRPLAKFIEAATDPKNGHIVLAKRIIALLDKLQATEKGETLHRVETAKASAQKILEIMSQHASWATQSGEARDASMAAMAFFRARTFYADIRHIILNSTEEAKERIGPYVVGGHVGRLKTQIIRPDCWFAPPPRCNIIFPEQVTQVSYDRIWTNEVTRTLLLIRNQLISNGGGALGVMMAQHAVAPDIGVAAQELIKATGSKGYRMLMPHEYHTGIIPRVDWLTDVAVAGAKDPEKKEETKPDKNALTKKDQGDLVSWSRQAAQFRFFKYRFGPRTLSISGRFNPRLVCGFPALYIDRPFLVDIDAKPGEKIANRVAASAAALGAPTQFVGQVEGLSHNVDQTGGTTSVSMSHVRRHNGMDDEFTDLLTKKEKRRTQRVRVLLRYDDLKRAGKEGLLRMLVDATPQPKDWEEVDESQAGGPGYADTLNQIAGYQILGQQNGEDYVRGNKVVKSVQPVAMISDGRRVVAPVETEVVTLEERVTETTVTRSAAGVSTTRRTSVTEYDVPINTPAIGQVVPADLSPVRRQPTKKVVQDLKLLRREGKIPGISHAVSVPAKRTSLACRPKGLFGKLRGIEVLEDAREVEPSVYAYGAVLLHEDILVGGTSEVTFESVVFPGWFSRKYENDKIGKEIYARFFGCLSVVDDLVVTDTAGETIDAHAREVEGPVIVPFDRDGKDLTAGQVKEMVGKADARCAELSTERAANLIAYLYGRVRSRGLDVESFIDQMTYRPIATKQDILGSDDLTVSVNAAGEISYTGVPGFHTMAVHPAVVDTDRKLLGLMVDASVPLARITGSKKSERIYGAYDVRREKYLAVKAYLASLLAHAFKG